MLDEKAAEMRKELRMRIALSKRSSSKNAAKKVRSIAYNRRNVIEIHTSLYPQKEMLASTVFLLYDVDGSGGLDPEELAGLLQALAIPFTEDGLLSVMQTVSNEEDFAVGLRDFVFLFPFIEKGNLPTPQQLLQAGYTLSESPLPLEAMADSRQASGNPTPRSEASGSSTQPSARASTGKTKSSNKLFGKLKRTVTKMKMKSQNFVNRFTRQSPSHILAGRKLEHEQQVSAAARALDAFRQRLPPPYECSRCRAVFCFPLAFLGHCRASKPARCRLSRERFLWHVGACAEGEDITHDHDVEGSGRENTNTSVSEGNDEGSKNALAVSVCNSTPRSSADTPGSSRTPSSIISPSSSSSLDSLSAEEEKQETLSLVGASKHGGAMRGEDGVDVAGEVGLRHKVKSKRSLRKRKSKRKGMAEEEIPEFGGIIRIASVAYWKIER